MSVEGGEGISAKEYFENLDKIYAPDHLAIDILDGGQRYLSVTYHLKLLIRSSVPCSQTSLYRKALGRVPS